MNQIILDDQTKRQLWKWSDLNLARAEDLNGIIHHRLAGHWPLTVRQIYYQLISSMCIRDDHWHAHGNPDQGFPKDLCQTIGILLKWMRISGKLPWDIINDEHRITGEKPGWDDSDECLDHVERYVRYMADDYQRCNAQNQENYIEVWLEKAALHHIVEEVTDKYCKRLIVNRGYPSITFLNNYKKRATRALQSGQHPVVHYYGDWDPSGEDMLEGGYQTLTQELDFPHADFYRGAINPDQFHLVKADPVLLKMEDRRSAKFIEKHGTMAFELDALHPKQLQKIVKENLLSMINIDTLQCEIERGEEEKEKLARLPGIFQNVFKQFKGGGMIRTRYQKKLEGKP